MLVVGPHQGLRDLQKAVEESNAHEEPHGPIPRDGNPTPSPNGLSETRIINGHTPSLLFVLCLLSLQISLDSLKACTLSIVKITLPIVKITPISKDLMRYR